jgi:hypothetical protein
VRSPAIRLPASSVPPTFGRFLGTLVAGVSLLGTSCGGGAQVGPDAEAAAPASDAPVVAASPGAWFDANGNLTVVGAGRRLRLQLSAPVLACDGAEPTTRGLADLAARASLPFHVLAEACRDTHPTILLPEESETASPAELERSYHEVARCTGSELALGGAWRPDVLQSVDPCPLALGLGWRLPTAEELSGLGPDDRRAVAGALFDTEVPGAFGGLVLYARDAKGELTLATLSPNAAEQAPAIPPERRDQPLFGASLRCVRDGAGEPPPHPVLPHAASCLREQRKSREQLNRSGVAAPLDLQKLRLWLDVAESQGSAPRTQKQLTELGELLASPTIQQLAREARQERALTERYAELAEAIDDPSVSAAERRRRREEFAHLRRRLGDRIVEAAEGASLGRAHLGAVLARLTALLESAAAAEQHRKKGAKLSYEPLLSRLRELAAQPTP